MTWRQTGLLVALAVLLALAGSTIVSSLRSQVQAQIPEYGYTVIRSYPHDPNAFTQGLHYADGILYEGTGLSGRSSIRRVNLETGEVLQHRDLSPEHFGEGITVWRSELIQLTWRSGVGFVYDRLTFEPRRTFRYSGEGWGLAHNGTELIMSDGTDELRFLDPATLAETRRVRVTAQGTHVRNLNELELVKGEVFANVLNDDVIARIDPKTGRVVGWIDMSGLLPPPKAQAPAVSHGALNGIAYDAAGDRLFVTGKLWPRLFEIELRPKTPQGR